MTNNDKDSTITKFSLIDQGAANLAASFIARSDKIQSTRQIIDLWDELRKKIRVESRLDYLVLILTQGRLMDLKESEKDYIKLVQENISNIRRELIVALTYPILGVKNGSQILADSYIVRLNDIASAMLAAAFTRLSVRVESAKEILDIWSKIREMNLVTDNNDYLIALLGTSRIIDLRKELEHPDRLKLIIDNFRESFNSGEPNIRITKLDLAAAYLTIAIVTQTPEVETNAQILDIWNKIKSTIKFNDDDLDITAAILTGGILINKTMKIEIDDIRDIFIKIKSSLIQQ
jgi:hypothetical protein